MLSPLVLFVGMAVIIALAALASVLAGSMWGLEKQVASLKRMSMVKEAVETLDPEEAIRIAITMRKSAAAMFLSLLGVVAIALTAVYVSAQYKGAPQTADERMHQQKEQVTAKAVPGKSGGTPGSVPEPSPPDAARKINTR